MLDELVELMGVAGGRCSYAEARHVARASEELSVRNGRVEEASRDESEGVGVRVRVGGAWGFAATRSLSREGLERALAHALAIAEAQPLAGDRPRTAEPPASGHWRGPFERDPFSVSLEEKLGLLVEAERALHGDRRLVRTEAVARATRRTQAFASTEGAACTQEHVTCGGGLGVAAVEGDELQVRSFPSAHGGHVAQAGWEHVAGLDLAGNAPRISAEAVELLSAPECPAGRFTVVLGAEQLALQIHESIGHALELDRILLGEAAYAGTSWVEDPRAPLRYGSEHLTIVADATAAGGLGTFGWDDEGTAARRTTLVDRGELRATLSDRESAAAIGLDASAGCARAEGFDRQPIVRMTNVSIEPGSAGTLEDLIAGTDDGLFLETNRSWSIDDRRLHFQFATETAREIKGGQLGRLLRNPVYSGVTPRFWSSLDAVCSAPAWQLHGVTNCGKGEPGQMMAVSHGAAPARFRDVAVGFAP